MGHRTHVPKSLYFELRLISFTNFQSFYKLYPLLPTNSKKGTKAELKVNAVIVLFYQHRNKRVGCRLNQQFLATGINATWGGRK